MNRSSSLFSFFLKPFQQVINVIDSVNVEKAAAFTNATAHLIQDSVVTCTNRARYVCFLVNGYCTVWILYCTVHVAVSSLPVTSGPKVDSNLALNESRNDGRPVLWLMSFYSLFTGLHFSFKISVVFFFSSFTEFTDFIFRYCSTVHAFPLNVMSNFPLKCVHEQGDRIGPVLRLVVAVFSVYSLSEVHQRRNILYAFKSDLAVG